MKKLFIILGSLLCLTGCFNNHSEKELNVYTSFYPVEYLTSYMYSDYANIKSIYPSGIDINTYSLTDKQKDIYSSGDYFIYTTNEMSLAVNFLNKNEDLNIIDASKGLTTKYDLSELWLDPSNYLMMAKNIKTSLVDYESKLSNQNTINDKYEELKLKISEIDVELTMLGKNAKRNTILADNDTFKFLEKYNINVISLDTSDSDVTKNYSEAKILVNNNDAKYVFVVDNDNLSDGIKSFISMNKLETIELETLYTLSEEEKKNNDNFIDLMYDNIDKLKSELYR